MFGQFDWDVIQRSPSPALATDPIAMLFLSRTCSIELCGYSGRSREAKIATPT